LIEKIESAYEKCSLPETPDEKEIEIIFIEMKKELYEYLY
jgi:hypothetical protein